jgi:rubrerythrin
MVDLSQKQRELLAAIDEAIAHEIRAQRQYSAKAKRFDIPVFNTLAEIEKKHERMLRALRSRVLKRIEARGKE